MGYGKTTAIREMLLKKSVRTIWQNIYTSGNADFWHGFCDAITELDEGFAESLRTMGVPADYKLLREVLDMLVKLRIDTHTFLVIDDYHLVKSDEVNRFIDIFLRNMPEKLHLIVATRNAFLDNSADLRLKRFVKQIGMEDLQFSQEDISEYYRLCGIYLTQQELDILSARSEGWVSALYLIMLDYIDHGAFTANSDIPALVRSVVYSPLSDQLKSFLHHVCMFDAFTTEQAAYMWRQENSGRLIDALVHRNAFIKRNTLTGKYHLHNIFAACIREEFSLLPEAARQELWQRAGHWHMQNKEYVDAMDCYYKSGDFEHLLHAFKYDRSYTTDGQYKLKMIQYLTDCPMEIRRKHHYAFLVYARLLFMVNEQALFSKICPELYREISEDTEIDETERNTLLGEFQLMISFSKYNSIEGMGNHFLQADKLMKAPSTILDTAPNWTMGAPSILYMFYREKGSLDKEIAMMRWGLGYYHKLTGGHGLGASEVFEAEICFMRGELEQSEILLHKALAKADETKQWSIILCAVFQQARNALLQSDYPRAVNLMKSMYETLKQQNRFPLLYTVDICQAYLYALLGQPDKIPSWVSEGKSDGTKMLFAVIPALQWAQSRAMLEQKKYLMLIGMSEQFFKLAGVFPNLLCSVYLHIHLAAAYSAINRHDDASGHLMTALEIAMPDRLYMPFVENGDRLGPILWNSACQTQYKKEFDVMRALHETHHKAVETIKALYLKSPAARLSEREEEVASLAALGLSNREISGRLFVSENTVKAHLKSAFDKLSIKSRAQLSDYLKQPHKE